MSEEDPKSQQEGGLVAKFKPEHGQQDNPQDIKVDLGLLSRSL